VRVKLDENLGTRGRDILVAAGWDVATIVGQNLCSAADDTVIEVCRVERRVLISLDTDFSNTLRYRPSKYSGIVVLRLPQPLTLDSLRNALSRVQDLARTRDPVGKLWIADEKRIREFVEDE
jgi:predicted nuclease of predicted toxin-antitoxin system